MTNGARINRITELMADEPHVQPAQRTQSQRLASRINGAKSHGPVSADGKLKCSFNAWKHGLLSQRFTPPADTRGDDRLFNQIHRELVTQFQPNTFLDAVNIDGLVFDLIQLCRARAMLESLQRPTAVPVEDLQKWNQLRDARRELKAVRRFLARLDAGQDPDCGRRTAMSVAKRVASLVEQYEADVMSPADADVVPEEEMDDVERAAFRQTKKDWAVIRPVKKKFANHKHIAAVIGGRVRLGGGELKPLHVVLGLIAENLQWFIKGQEKFENKISRHQDKALLSMARAPHGLLLLRRYATRIECAIERKLTELRRP